MNKRVAIVQSNYIPWKGYFDLINRVDEFILYDTVQYTRRDWRNRNKIKTRNGLIWLTIAVEVKGKFFQKIKDTRIIDPRWNRKHWNTIVHSYSNAKYFKKFREQFEELYLGCQEKYLSQINYRFITSICEMLGIRTKISWSMDYVQAKGRNGALIDLCKQAGASEYISGPTAKSYIDEALFDKNDIKISYINYSGYRKYNQLFPPFEHAVSIVDLIFNIGAEAKNYIKSFKPL